MPFSPLRNVFQSHISMSLTTIFSASYSSLQDLTYLLYGHFPLFRLEHFQKPYPHKTNLACQPALRTEFVSSVGRCSAEDLINAWEK
jgi:hypothetical protein